MQTKFIDIFRFMSTSLSKAVDNMSRNVTVQNGNHAWKKQKLIQNAVLLG